MTYRIKVEYDGAPYCGWQRQSGVPTVQQTLEDTLAVLLRKHTVITGAGRTDTGVHARGQVAHFVAEDPIEIRRVLHSWNGLLPTQIAVLDATAAPDRFHARFDARGRTYRYYISMHARALDAAWRETIKCTLDFDAMNIAASNLEGSHHFGAFCRVQSETKNRVCCVKWASWRAESRDGDWYFEIVADRFLHGMVRTVVGTLLEVGRGRRSPEELLTILESKDRTQAGPAAPAHGLVLESVHY